MTTPVPTSFQTVVEELRRHGVVLRQLPGEYSVNYRNGRPSTEYRTDELADALAHGLAMDDAPVPEAPLGPMGKPMSRRALMYRHNRKIAAKRLKRRLGGSTAARGPSSTMESDQPDGPP